MNTDEGPVLIAVVSDGAGSARESEWASDRITRSLMDLLAPAVASGGFTTHTLSPEQLLREYAGTVLAEIVRWAGDQEHELRDYSATLLCAVIGPSWSLYGQIGDGAMVRRHPTENGWSAVFWPDRGEYANTTSFLVSPGGLEKLRVEFLPYRPDAVALFSDGLQDLVLRYQDQTVQSSFFDRMIGPVRASGSVGEDQKLSDGLRAYLGTKPVTDRSDDDITLVLACLSPSGTLDE